MRRLAPVSEIYEQRLFVHVMPHFIIDIYVQVYVYNLLFIFLLKHLRRRKDPWARLSAPRTRFYWTTQPRVLLSYCRDIPTSSSQHKTTKQKFYKLFPRVSPRHLIICYFRAATRRVGRRFLFTPTYYKLLPSLLFSYLSSSFWLVVVIVLFSRLRVSTYACVCNNKAL